MKEENCSVTHLSRLCHIHKPLTISNLRPVCVNGESDLQQVVWLLGCEVVRLLGVRLLGCEVVGL